VCVAGLAGQVALSDPCVEGVDPQRIPMLVGEAAGAGPMVPQGTPVTNLLLSQPGGRSGPTLPTPRRPIAGRS
jgi:hypothetical protein